MSSALPESAELLRLADACVQCGLCLPHCPTYADSASETESPRGRILLARAMGSGRISAAEADADGALSHCLGCRACEAACPAKVEYGSLLQLSRSALRRERRPPSWQAALEWLLAKPRWLASAATLARWLQPLPGCSSRLPPLPPAGSLPALQAPEGVRRGRLALVQGCVAAHWETATHRAALRLLSRLGWEVAVLAPACCGSLHRHAGAGAVADRLRLELAAAIEQSGADQVLHAGSGCHEGVREAAGGRPTHEVCAFIADDRALDRLTFAPSNQRIGLHIACSQRHLVRRPDAERRLLARVPGLQLCQPAPAACCGAAGIQALRFPQQSEQRMGELRRWYREQAPDRLLAGNLGCRLQLIRRMDPERGLTAAEHPLEFLNRHLR